MFNRSFFSNLPPATKNLLILNLIIWAFMAIAPATTSSKIVELGGLHPVESHDFGIWQLFTYMFLHANFMHLFFNMWALLMFGYLVERAFGTKRYLFYYLSCGVGAAIIQLGVYELMIHNASGALSSREYSDVIDNGWNLLRQGLNYSDPVMGNFNVLVNFSVTIGASGAIFGILLAFGMLFPNLQMYLFFIPMPIKAKWVVLGYGIIEFFLGVAGSADSVAHFAHLGGMLFGFIMIWYWKKKSPGAGTGYGMNY